MNVEEKRETAKGLILVKHWVFGECVLLVKEKSGKYGLLGGGIEKKYGKKEKKDDALRRELKEEIGQDHHIERIKDLVKIETRSQIHNVFALEIEGKLQPSPDEIYGFAFYPLKNNYWKERKALRCRMEPYAVKAVTDFRHKPNWTDYDVSKLKIGMKYRIQFMIELKRLKNEILKK